MKKILHINEHNEIIGSVSYDEALDKGYMRRIARVYVFDTGGKILLQKRSSNMRTFPGYWDQSAGGHVDAGETDIVAAQRELKEELNIESELNEITVGHRSKDPNDKVFSSIYTCKVPEGTEVLFNKHEVAEIKWFDIDELEREIDDDPDKFVPNMITIWREYSDKMIKL